MILTIDGGGIVVDSFAGGGAGHGIAKARGQSAELAINHCDHAIAMYRRNHPGTLAMREDVFGADLREAIGERRIALLWASPDCRDFSRAKGDKPVSRRVRGLAWVVVKWAEQHGPDVIILENVREFQGWGPVVPMWKCRDCAWRGTEKEAPVARVHRHCPKCNSVKIYQSDKYLRDPAKEGITFNRWVGRLKNLGYRVEWRLLNAADFGAPTHRRRLFLVARRDGKPIVWPEQTHGDSRKINATPLFARLKPWRTAAECIDWDVPCPSIFDRKRDLKPKSQFRIAMAIKRFVLENPKPYIVGVGGRMGQSPPACVDQPMNTITAKNDRAIVIPVLYQLTHGGDRKPISVEAPMPTITTAHRGEIAAVSSTLINIGYGERKGQAARAPGLNKPLGTVVAGGCKHYLVAAFLVKHFGGVIGAPIDAPCPTCTARATQNQLAVASFVHFNHGQKQWSAVDEPMRTVTTNNHARLVFAFLVKYFGNSIGQSLTEPMHTVTANDHFGLVVVEIDGEFWMMIDIGMRMLTPRELARAQGFPDSYELIGSKTQQIARIGNSVPPIMAEVLSRANVFNSNGYESVR